MLSHGTSEIVEKMLEKWTGNMMYSVVFLEKSWYIPLKTYLFKAYYTVFFFHVAIFFLGGHKQHPINGGSLNDKHHWFHGFHGAAPSVS